MGWPLAAMSAGLPVETLRPCLCTSSSDPGAARRASFISIMFLTWIERFAVLLFGVAVIVVTAGGGYAGAALPRSKTTGHRPAII